jgi:hypothetical protein
MPDATEYVSGRLAGLPRHGWVFVAARDRNSAAHPSDLGDDLGDCYDEF